MFQEGRRIDKMTARSKRRRRGVGVGMGRLRDHRGWIISSFFTEWTQMQEPFCALLLGESLPFHYDFRITVEQ